jgi:hypothetical protein
MDDEGRLRRGRWYWGDRSTVARLLVALVTWALLIALGASRPWWLPLASIAIILGTYAYWQRPWLGHPPSDAPEQAPSPPRSLR